MSFHPGEYQPYPVSENRAETPPIDFDLAQPFTGLELIVSGLPRTTLTASHDRLQQIIQELRNQGRILPQLDIVSPATNDPLDYVWVSLADPLKEIPLPDILENVRILLDQVPELRAGWKVSASRMDKSRQLYFQAGDDVNLVSRKTKLDNIFRLKHLDVQTSWAPKDGRRLQPPEVDRRFCRPRHSRYIQPKFGQEVAINGVGGYPQAKTMINRYLQNTYNDGTDNPVVRDSRVELDGSVYCAVLRTPHVTSRFLTDPLNPALGNENKVPAPQYLYTLNTQGIPSTSSAFGSKPSAPPSQDPYLQRQIDSLSTTSQTVVATLQHVLDKQSETETRYQRDRTKLTEAFQEATHAYSLNNLVTTAQMEITTLQNSLDQQEMLKIMLNSDDPRIKYFDNRITTSIPLVSPAAHDELRLNPFKFKRNSYSYSNSYSNSNSYPIHRVSRSFFLLCLVFLVLLPVISAAAPHASTSLRFVSVNANGLAHEMKVSAIESMVDSIQPHALVIGETKSSRPVARRLSLKGYDLHEEPGRSTSRNTAKWGVILAVRRGFFNVQRVPTQDALRGRVVALDLSIPTTNHKAFSHRLIGIYAPWNPGGTQDEEHLFWPSITQLCHSWSMSGDFNAYLSVSETSSSSVTVSPSQTIYSQFLRDTNAIDLWQTQHPIDVLHDWTYRSHTPDDPQTDETRPSATPSYSILDRTATSRNGVISGSIETLSFFLPVTDHRAISSLIVLSSACLRQSLMLPHLPLMHLASFFPDEAKNIDSLIMSMPLMIS